MSLKKKKPRRNPKEISVKSPEGISGRISARISQKSLEKLLESYPGYPSSEIPKGTLNTFWKDLWEQPSEKLWNKSRDVLLHKSQLKPQEQLKEISKEHRKNLGWIYLWEQYKCNKTTRWNLGRGRVRKKKSSEPSGLLMNSRINSWGDFWKYSKRIFSRNCSRISRRDPGKKSKKNRA